MIEVLEQAGFRDQRVLDAMAKLPRHFFLDKAFEEWAYQNVAFPIGSGQTISQPQTVAIQTSLLQIQPGDIVLEVGTGSGYQACILSLMGAKVYTIERQTALFHKTNALLKEIGFGSIRTFLGDGYAGLPMLAPFKKILVTAGADQYPDTLGEQLSIGGTMVIPIGKVDEQTMWRFTRKSNVDLVSESFGKFKFVPFLSGLA